MLCLYKQLTSTELFNIAAVLSYSDIARMSVLLHVVSTCRGDWNSLQWHREWN